MTDGPNELARGATIAHFRVVSKLGQGAMGVVYEAMDEKLHRRVALKVLPHELTSNGERRHRFVREARTAASITHASIATIYDVGEVDGLIYIAMELVEGETLARLLARAPLSVDAALTIAIAIARGLAKAHERRIVHRDLKPDNVMVSGGEVKILDFGLAKQRGLPTSLEKAETATQEGTFLGTPAYMSPEQLVTSEVDERSDVFSFGILLYEMLTGSRPFVGDSVIAVVVAISRDPHEPPSKKNARVSAGLDRIVAKCLEKAPDARYANAGELLRDLEAVPAERAEPRSRSWALVGAALLVVAVASVVVLRAKAPAPSMPATPPAAASCDARSCSALGAPARCRRGRCVPIASPECDVLAEPRDLADDRTVYVGLVFPWRNEPWAVANRNAAELARREIAQTMSGVVAHGDARAIALVACDESNAREVARHLAEDVGVAAVLGFGSTADVVELAPSVFFPNDVLVVSAENVSTLLGALPQPAGTPRLFFRTIFDAGQTTATASRFVAEYLEPMARASARFDRARPLRVAVLRTTVGGSESLSRNLLQTLRFNGKPALENGADFVEIAVGEPDASIGRTRADAIRDLVAFAPHVVIPIGTAAWMSDVLGPMESAWRKGQDLPFVVAPELVNDQISRHVGHDRARQRRFFGITTVSTPLNADFVHRFNAAFADPISASSSPNTTYDAVYLLAYATYAVGDAPVTGASLSRAFARLVPPGKSIDVGPATLYEALGVLRAGGNVDVVGTTGPLDFDLARGEAQVDLAIVCVGTDSTSPAPMGVESGVVYRAATGKLEGKLRCGE